MIIDFRVRAPFAPYEKSMLFAYKEAISEGALDRVDAPMPPSALNFSMPMLIEEAKQAGVDKLVVPVRRQHGDGNPDLVKLIKDYPDYIIGLAGIDVAKLDAAFDDIKKYVIEGPCKGIILEPAQEAVPWRVNASWVYPLYEFCQANNVPIAFTYGGIMIKSLRDYDPYLIDDVAAAFPKLKIALCHGGWPFVAEACHIALNRNNVWLAPDLYMLRSPGSEDYFMAANHLLKNRMIFATAYPLLPLFACVKAYREKLSEAAFPLVMGKNAEEFLGLA